MKIEKHIDIHGTNFDLLMIFTLEENDKEALNMYKHIEDLLDNAVIKDYGLDQMPEDKV